MNRPSDEAIDQIAHVILGFIAAFIFARLLIWVYEWVHQWPPGKPFVVDDPSRQYRPTRVTQLDRVADTKKDLLYFDIGYTAGQMAQVAIVAVWAS